jgi:hypothetical protein
MPSVPVTWEAEAEGSLESRGLRPPWATKKEKKFPHNYQ